MQGLGGISVTAVGVGDIELHVEGNDCFRLQNVLYIPDATIQLISVRCLTRDSNAITHFNKDACWITNNSTGNILARGNLIPYKNLYALTLHPTRTEHAYTIHPSADLETWHRRLGHANYQSIMDMIRIGLIPGASPCLSQKPPKCDSCVLGKQTRNPIPKV